MRRTLLLILCALGLTGVCGQMRSRIDVSLSDELYCMHFDAQGLLWMGTSSGIRAYDGYEVHRWYVSAIEQYPQLRSDVRCIVTDGEGYLWAGTNDGLVRITMHTGAARLYRFPKQSQQIIYALFVAGDGVLYAGTDDGFSVYDSAGDKFVHYNVDNARAIYATGDTAHYNGWGVKDFVETADGDILIGTWRAGIWRYSPRTGLLRGYGKLNWMNSAYALCLDSEERLWIGTQACGVQRMERADDYRLQTLHSVEEVERESVVYDMVQMPGGAMYVCTDDTIAAAMGPDGALWVAMRSGSIERVAPVGNEFSAHCVEGSIRSLFTADGQHCYLGYGMKGLAWYDIKEGTVLYNGDIPGCAALPTEDYTARITSIVQRYDGELWMAAGDNGVLVSRPDGSSEVLYARSRGLPYVNDNVTVLYESPYSRTLWIGQRQGVSYLTADGRGAHLDIKEGTLDMTGYFMVNHITGDRRGNVWISSASDGIVCISENTMEVAHYPEPCVGATACFVDSRDRVWAICTDGLFGYDQEKGRFEQVGIPLLARGKKILAINEDRYGALWLATEQALVRVDSAGGVCSFTQADGVACTSFLPNSTFCYGDSLYFGTAQGFVAFEPAREYADSSGMSPHLLITDIHIDGASPVSADSWAVQKVTHGRIVGVQHITVPPRTKTLAIKLALLTYANPREVVYSYLLDGYNDEWQYVDGDNRTVTLAHVPPGKYQLHLCADDSKGNRFAMPYPVVITVLAPWYRTWWAGLIFITLLAVAGWFVWDYIRMQREVKASRRFSTILQSAQIRIATPTDGAISKEEAGSGETHTYDAKQRRNAEFTARATQLVYENLENADYNRDRMAADLGMSVSSLYARLHECTDLSIQTFIQTIRLNAACDILKSDPQIRISELAYRVGFNTPKYFSQCFKREFGILPGEYAKKA